MLFTKKIEKLNPLKRLCDAISKYRLEFVEIQWLRQ